MSSTDSFSQCSSSFESRSDRGSIIYNSNHLLDVLYGNGGCLQRNILFTVISLDNAVKMKVRDTLEYSFNFTVLIDWSTFEKMKREQSLDITFDDFQPQIVELLKQTVAKQMQMRLEADDIKCKVVFYEKSRLKSLIFLTIDLGLTNQKELVDEMSSSISQLKDFNKNVSAQLALSKNQLRETELLLKGALAKNCQIEKQFHKDLELILQTLLNHLNQTETNISTEISKLTKRHQKLLKDVEAVRRENVLKCESSARLVQSMQNLRFENERNHRAVQELTAEVDSLKGAKVITDQSCVELRQCISSKDEQIETLQKQINELRRDVQDATMIIAQKTKTNDEIGKDLLEANRLLVNFNNQCDILSNETDQLKERLVCKDDIIRGQVAELEQINREFQNYRNLYNADDVKRLQHDLFLARQRVEELEKQNKEAVKLNGLLTKKLSTGDIFESRNAHCSVPPKC